MCRAKLRKLNNTEQDLMFLIEKIFRKTLQDLEEPLTLVSLAKKEL